MRGGAPIICFQPFCHISHKVLDVPNSSTTLCLCVLCQKFYSFMVQNYKIGLDKKVKPPLSWMVAHKIGFSTQIGHQISFMSNLPFTWKGVVRKIRWCVRGHVLVLMHYSECYNLQRGCWEKVTCDEAMWRRLLDLWPTMFPLLFKRKSCNVWRNCKVCALPFLHRNNM